MGIRTNRVTEGTTLLPVWERSGSVGVPVFGSSYMCVRRTQKKKIRKIAKWISRSRTKDRIASRELSLYDCAYLYSWISGSKK